MDKWLGRHEREVAALLAGETGPACLSDQEIQETLKYKYSYYQTIWRWWNGIRRSWWTRRKAARTRSTSWRWPTCNWRS